jgi:hypothetical protein
MNGSVNRVFSALPQSHVQCCLPLCKQRHLQSNSDLSERVAGSPIATCQVVDDPYVSTASAPAAQSIHC